MRVSLAEIDAELRPFIQSLWVVESPGGLPASELNFAAPNGCPKLIAPLENTILSIAGEVVEINREGGMYFVGNRDSPVLLQTPASRTRFIGIEFRPQGAHSIFGMPMIETTNGRYSADV